MITNLKIVEIETCMRPTFSELSRSRSAQDSGLPIIKIETWSRQQFSRLLRRRLLETKQKVSRLRFFRDFCWSLSCEDDIFSVDE